MALVLMLGALMCTDGVAQDFRLLDCAALSFVGPACVVVVPVSVPPTAAPPIPAPLFPPGTLAPDTPPLMMQLLQEPTVDNAQAYLDWQTRRMARIQEVQQLLRTLTKDHGTKERP